MNHQEVKVKIDILGTKACYNCGYVDLYGEPDNTCFKEKCPQCKNNTVVSFEYALTCLYELKSKRSILLENIEDNPEYQYEELDFEDNNKGE